MKQINGPLNVLMGMACLAALASPMAVLAHPDYYVPQRANGSGPPVPQDSSSAAQRTPTQGNGAPPSAEPARNLGRAAGNDVAPTAPPTRGLLPGANGKASSGPETGKFPTGNRHILPAALQRGYKSNVLTCMGQASHEHKLSQDDVKTNPVEKTNPLEIWYVSTRKTTKEAPGTPYYCVAARVESATSESWARSFDVRLIAVDAEGNQSNVRRPVSVEGISAGESREVFSHCVQGTAPRNWIIDTPHGWAEVVFPQPGGQKGPSCGGIASGRSE